MSIAALADDEILRTSRKSLKLEAIVERHLGPIIAAAGASGDQRANVRAVVQPVAAENPIQKAPPATALDGLVKYIPTETVTLYVAATAAITNLTTAFPSLTPFWLYWGFVVLTPILFVLIYLGKRRAHYLVSWVARASHSGRSTAITSSSRCSPPKKALPRAMPSARNPKAS